MNHDEIDAIMAQMFQQAHAQFGKAIKGYWFYEDDPCPGCGRAIDAAKIKGQRSLSLNAFIYRERGILIGYFLCGRCAEKIFKAAERNPYKQTPLHTTIEENLVKAYRRHLH
ncbi:MAG: hypothetical protein R3A44_28745 [Caldilineaceae bacterium]